MDIPKVALCGFAIVVGSTVRIVSGAESLDWKLCVREALEKNRELIAAKSSWEESLYAVRSAGSKYLPELSGSASYGRSKAGESDQSDSYSYGLSARQMVYDGGRTSSDVGVARARADASEQSLRAASARVRYRLNTAFAGLLKAQKLVVLESDIGKRREQLTKLVRLRYEAGREHRGSLLTAEAREAEAATDREAAARSLAVAKRRLATEVGLDPGTDITATGALQVPLSGSKEPDFDALAKQTPNVLETGHEVRVALEGVRSSRASFLPSVDISASVSRSADEWPPRDDDWRGGVSLSLPIFRGGQRVADFSKSKSAYRRMLVVEEKQCREAAEGLQRWWVARENAIARIGVRRKFMDAALERARIAESQYTSGMLSFDNWIIIEDDAVTAEKSLLDAQVNAMVSDAEWTQAKGGTLEDEER